MANLNDQAAGVHKDGRRRWAKTSQVFGSELFPLSKSQGKRLLETDPTFPRPRRVGRDMYWSVDELQEWLDRQHDAGYTPRRWRDRESS